ncbi:low-density lipoprotein receptor class A domain-containing protein 1-like isoform X1 [Erpetoichthys calabaricus]|uniref:low-density lipoprotein receptor class A domain-containing protein 1-like isoform X1 n=1 Tax=Erpetoichthys calabaricus TaxID=27687 RepID=UPI002234E888|nr:low-density lipoprotein receptor class A domain-containing protein 1-like isoform X1 [Erpetoichthys calabaricus]
MHSNTVYPEYQDVEAYSVTSRATSRWGSEVSLAPRQYKEKVCGGCVTRRCLLIIFGSLIMIGLIAAAIALGSVYGIPPRDTGLYTRTCSLQSNSSGFLCDDRTTCLTASRICDGKVDCHNGEDESKLYCGNLPHSLPSDLVFMCANKISWTYIDNVCDAKNDCGDCSDETTKKCLSCLGWRCNTVFFKDCDCIPKSRCKDTFQDCDDWSDENVCQP